MVDTAGWIEITSETELSELLGAPTARAANKDRVRLHERDREWLVEIEQLFFHGAKAFLRSALWQPETWQPDALPSRAALCKTLETTTESLEDLERYYGPEYARQLYG